MNSQAPDPEYELRWPPHIFQDELENMVRRGRDVGTTTAWEDEVEQLLRQAFASDRPANDFLQLFRPLASPPTVGYDPEENPF